MLSKVLLPRTGPWAFWNCQNRLSVDSEGIAYHDFREIRQLTDSHRPQRGLWNFRYLYAVRPEIVNVDQYLGLSLIHI